MTDVGRRSSRVFKKRAHRPWKTGLLEKAIKETTIDATEDLVKFDLDLEIDTTEDDTSFYPDFNFVDETSKFSKLEMIPEPQREIKQEIFQTKQQQKLLAQQINEKSNVRLSLGGFFQPQQLTTLQDSQAGRKISSLLSNLKNQEQKITSLTSSLKISEAVEQAKLAEINFKAEANARHVAEQRMRQAVQQAEQVAEQFRTAMDQANQASMAQQEEAELRKLADKQAQEAKIRANNAEIDLQDERLARLAAEDKAQHAMQVAESAYELQRQLQTANDQISKFTEDKSHEEDRLSALQQRLEQERQHEETRRVALQARLEELNHLFIKVEDEHKVCGSRIYELEIQNRELTATNAVNTQKIAEFDAQRENLKNIIAAEQDLRKSAERKFNDILARAEKAEKGWQAADQQRKIIEARAKRAVEHASRTVMHLLNAPPGNDFAMQFPTDTPAPPETTQSATPGKPRIQMPVAISTPQVYDYSEEDLKY